MVRSIFNENQGNDLINAHGNINGTCFVATPLNRALLSGRVEIAKLLLEYEELDINKTTNAIITAPNKMSHQLAAAILSRQAQDIIEPIAMHKNLDITSAINSITDLNLFACVNPKIFTT